jgi:hypothetical protein
MPQPSVRRAGLFAGLEQCSLPVWTLAWTCGMSRSPPVTPIPVRRCGLTGPARTSTATPTTFWPPTWPPARERALRLPAAQPQGDTRHCRIAGVVSAYLHTFCRMPMRRLRQSQSRQSWALYGTTDRRFRHARSLYRYVDASAQIVDLWASRLDRWVMSQASNPRTIKWLNCAERYGCLEAQPVFGM